MTLSSFNLLSHQNLFKEIYSISRCDQLKIALENLDKTTESNIRTKLCDLWIETTKLNTPFFNLDFTLGFIEGKLVTEFEQIKDRKEFNIYERIKAIYDDIFHLTTLDTEYQKVFFQYTSSYYLEAKNYQTLTIRHTSEGSMGFPMKIEVNLPLPRNFFVKYLTHEHEFEAHAAYYLLLKCSSVFHHFVVPQALIFKLDEKQPRYQKICLNESNDELDIDVFVAKKVRVIFTEIAMKYIPSGGARPPEDYKFIRNIQAKHICIQEQLLGANLSDIIDKHYIKFDTEQKKALFFDLGALTFLDVILGNRDRIIKYIEPRGDGYAYSLEIDPGNFLPSNTGNILILNDERKGSNLFKLGIIDNEVLTESFHSRPHNIENSNAYNQFLRSIFSEQSTNTEGLLTQQAKICLTLQCRQRLKGQKATLSKSQFLKLEDVTGNSGTNFLSHSSTSIVLSESSSPPEELDLFSTQMSEKPSGIAKERKTHQESILSFLQDIDDPILFFNSFKSGMEMMRYELETNLRPLWKEEKKIDYSSLGCEEEVDLTDSISYGFEELITQRLDSLVKPKQAFCESVTDDSSFDKSLKSTSIEELSESSSSPDKMLENSSLDELPSVQKLKEPTLPAKTSQEMTDSLDS